MIKLKDLIREDITDLNIKLSSKELTVAQDILGEHNLSEVSSKDILNKLKKYKKAGLITLGILIAILAALYATGNMHVLTDVITFAKDSGFKGFGGGFGGGSFGGGGASGSWSSNIDPSIAQKVKFLAKQY